MTCTSAIVDAPVLPDEVMTEEPASNSQLQTSTPRALILLAALFAVIGAASFVPYFANLDLYLRVDWRYYDALALVCRSAVLSYGEVPLHDPWILGGADILSNPQSRLFSPIFLADLAFPPYVVNAGSIIVYGALGGMGLFLFLRRRDVDWFTSIAAAVLFLNAGWFGLHWAEGHVAFGQFQLYPWLLLGLERVDERRWQLLLGLLIAYFIVDGAMYPFVFSIFIIGTSWFLFPGAWRRLLGNWRRDWWWWLLVTATAGLLVVPNVVPPLAMKVGRSPELEQYTMEWGRLAHGFFFPFHDVVEKGDEPYRWFEYSCYVGVLSVATVAVSLAFGAESRRRIAKYLAVVAVFFFIGAGLGGPVDPWRLFHYLPVLNSAHVQSRLFFFIALFWPIIIALAVTRLPWVNVRRAVLVVLVLESFVVKLYPMQHAYQTVTADRPSAQTIETTEWKVTVPGSIKPIHYYQGGLGSVTAYDPAAPPTSVRAFGRPGYRGEAYPLDGPGTAQIVRYVPRELIVAFDLAAPGRIQLNTNQLLGWSVAEGPGKVVEDASGLLTIETTKRAGAIRARYTPWYWPWVYYSFLLGLALAVVCIWIVRKHPEHTTARA